MTQTPRLRACIFIDYWNYQVSWNERFRNGKTPDEALMCNWRRVPRVFGEETAKALGLGNDCALEIVETRYYVSVLKDDPVGTKQEAWLRDFISNLPRTTVRLHERKLRQRPVRCRKCACEIETCPECRTSLHSAPEKGVDVSLATDMMAKAWDGAMDVAILATQDADFIPLVRCLQARGIKVVNIGWRKGGNDLARCSTAHAALDSTGSRLGRRKETVVEVGPAVEAADPVRP